MSLSRFLDPQRYVRTPMVELQKKTNGGNLTQYTTTLPGDKKLLILLDKHEIPQPDGRVKQNVHVYEMPRVSPLELQQTFGFTPEQAHAAIGITKELRAKKIDMELVRCPDQKPDTSLQELINKHCQQI